VRVAEQERDAALRIVAAAKAAPERMEAMRQSHAADLEAQAQQAKKRFAEELMATLSTAHAAWKQDTERRLQRARKAAQKDLVRAKAAWRRRSTAFVRAADWQTRERALAVAHGGTARAALRPSTLAAGSIGLRRGAASIWHG
jgi:broad specificity phosphatase PhoE